MSKFGRVTALTRLAITLPEFSPDVIYSLANRLWAAGSGIILIILVGLLTTPVVQGFYYTFNSLVYMQVFVEMGLGVAIVQLIGHEMARLKHSPCSRIDGNEAAKARLRSIVRFAGIWFIVGSIALFCTLSIIGLIFFSLFGRDQLPSGDLTGTLAAWVLVSLGVAMGLLVNGALFVVEGVGHVASAARIRLLQGIVGTSGAAITLICGGEVFAIASQTLLMSISGLALLAYRHRAMLVDLWEFQSTLPGISWRKDVWPFQSRIAVSWLSGFFALQMFSPLLFALDGPESAGRMGMTLQIFAALNGMFIVLITAQTPIFTRLIALGRRKELRQRFARASKYSLSLLVAALTALGGALILGSFLLPDLQSRIVPWPYLLPLFLTCVANHILFTEAAFLRAHREEPFMLLSAGSAILTFASASALIAFYGMLGAVASYSAITLLFSMPIGTLIFLRYWNADV